MKHLLPVAVAVSLAANLILAGILFAGRGTAAAPSALPARPHAASAAARGPAAEAPPWTDLGAQALPALVERLRHEGLPPHLLRALVQARLQEQFAPRFKALRPDAASRPYWKTALVDPQVRAAEFALYREQQKMMRDLLGADAEQPDFNIYQHRRFETVPAARLQDVKDSLRQLEERRQEIYAQSPGMITPELQRRVAALEQEHQATLAAILTPAELEEYNLRNSDTARNLRFELSAFQPTEEEFRAIYRLQSQLPPYEPNLTPAEMQRRGELHSQMREQIKAMLGPARATEYQRASDFSYRQTSQLVARLELPPETTVRVWDVRQALERRASDVRRDSKLPAAERDRQLTALAQEGSQQVAALLGGQRGLEAFKQNGGYWIEALKPRPAGGATTGGALFLRGP